MKPDFDDPYWTSPERKAMIESPANRELYMISRALDALCDRIDAWRDEHADDCECCFCAFMAEHNEPSRGVLEDLAAARWMCDTVSSVLDCELIGPADLRRERVRAELAEMDEDEDKADEPTITGEPHVPTTNRPD